MVKRNMKRAIFGILCGSCLALLTVAASGTGVYAYDFDGSLYEEDDTAVLSEENSSTDILTEAEDNGSLTEEAALEQFGADGEVTDGAGAYFDVTAFGANGNDKSDDREAINAALFKANEIAEHITVHIPAGTYYIAGSLFIYSDTTLKIDPNAIIRETSDFGDTYGVMIIGSHLGPDGKVCKCSLGDESCGCNAGGYTKCHDITIDGGKWIAYKNPNTKKCPRTQIAAFRHAHDITLQNMICQNAAGHFVNLSGVDTATVSNVTFESANKFDGDASKGEEADNETALFTREFIHLDYCTSDGEAAYGIPYDKTPAKNITVTGCTFSNGYAGVGNHHPKPDGAQISSNIVVSGCTFTKMESYVVGEYSVDGLTVENCNANDCMMFALASDSSNIKLLNNTYDAVKTHKFDDLHDDRSGVSITLSNAVTVSGNTIKNTKNAGISITNSTNVDITGNKISKTGRDGIAVKSDKNGSITSNTVKNAKEYGLEYRSCTGMTVSDNNLSSKDSAMFLIGDKASKGGKSQGNFLNNTLSSKKKFDLYLGRYCTTCNFSGNKLVNYTFEQISKTYKGTIDLPKINKIILKKRTYVFNGKKIKPPVTVKDSIGRTLVEGKDYNLYYKKPIGPGTATIVVEGKARTIYKGQIKKTTYKIIYKE